MRNGFRLTVTARTSRVLSSFGAPALLGLSTLAAGCGDNGKTSQPNPVDAVAPVQLTQDNNFSSMSTLTIPPVAAPPGDNLKVCWDQLNVDIQGHALDPKKDINDVSFVQVKRSSPADVAKLLNDGTLDAKNDVKGDWEKQFEMGNDSACVQLSDLVTVPETASSTAMDPKTAFVTDNTVTYLMLFSTGIQIGYGARMMTILQTDTGATSDNIDVKNTSASLSYTATFGPKPLAVPAGAVPRVDWSQVTKGGAGQTVGTNDVSRVLIGFYANMQPADLQKNFLNLQQPDGTDVGSPTMSWEVSVQSGQSADLSLATGRSDSSKKFTGFTPPDGQTGSWIMGMFCDACQNPAPVIVTLVDPQ